MKRLRFLGILMGLFGLTQTVVAQLTLPKLEDVGTVSWVRQKLDIYPELHWLLDEGVHATQEGQSQSTEHSWSVQIAGKHHPEFERTMSSMVNIYLVLTGGDIAYHRFVEAQSASDKLSRANFDGFHKFAREVITDSDMLHALEVNLLLGDMGKTKKVRERAVAHGLKNPNPDHDIFLEQCLHTCPQIFPTYEKLSEPQKALLARVAGLVHFGHVTHVEGPAKNLLKKLKASGVLKSKDFDFEILTHMLDVSAARAHEDNHGSKVITETTYHGLEAMKKAINYLSEHTEEEAIKYYLELRASWMGFSLNTTGDLVLARLAAMMRLYTPEEGKALQEGFQALRVEERESIERELNPLMERPNRTPTYIPAVLVNLQTALVAKTGRTREESISQTVKIGLPVIVDTLVRYREGKMDQPYRHDMTLCFNKLAGQARENPTSLIGGITQVDADGNVSL